MPKMLQVRHIPDSLHRELKRRAKARGQTLTAFVQEILERELSRAPKEQVFARIAGRERVALPRPAAEIIREEREARERYVTERTGLVEESEDSPR